MSRSDVDLLVGLDQLERRRSQERRLGLRDSTLVQPLVALVVDVDAAQRGPQLARQDDLAECLALRS